MNKFKRGDKVRIKLPGQPDRDGQIVEIFEVKPDYGDDPRLTQYWYRSPAPSNFGDLEWLSEEYLEPVQFVPTFTTIDEANEWLNNATTP